MTPLIATMVSVLPNTAASFHWFEMEMPKTAVPINGELMARQLPFPNVALVSLVKNDPLAVLLSQDGEKTRCVPVMHNKGKLFEGKPFVYWPSEETSGVNIHYLDGSPFEAEKSNASAYVGFVGSFLRKLEASAETGYLPVKRANHAKRIRQGKVPLYDWNTIVVEPPKPKAEPQGGTHTSPRWHERRGHWRNLKNNKRVWVRNCEVGNKARGAVFHDYVVKETV